MKRPSLDDLSGGLRDWMDRHPTLTSRVLFWALLGSIVGIGLFLALSTAVLVSLTWGVSRPLAILMGTLTLALWLYTAALLFSQRNTDHAYSRALKQWMQKAHEDDADSQWQLLEAYRDGTHGVMKDPAAQGWWLRKLAESGDTRAMLELAVLLNKGHGLLRDRVQARVWLDRAASAGDPRALELQGEWNQDGGGGPPGSETE